MHHLSPAQGGALARDAEVGEGGPSARAAGTRLIAAVPAPLRLLAAFLRSLELGGALARDAEVGEGGPSVRGADTRLNATVPAPLRLLADRRELLHLRGALIWDTEVRNRWPNFVRAADEVAAPPLRANHGVPDALTAPT